MALLFAAASCSATPPPPVSNGGEGGSDEAGGNGGSGGSGGSGGKPATGGSGGGAGGKGGTAGGGSGGSGGSSGSGGSGAGGTAGSGSPDAAVDTGGTPPITVDMPTCTTEPAATPPGLKKTPVVRVPEEAGQVIGVPGEKGIYILGHETGKIYYAVDGKVDPTPMATIAIKNNKPQNEQGLLGITLHPKFAQNRLFYVVYTAPNANIRIDEMERTGMTSSKMTRIIWDGKRVGGGAFHNGGQIAFNAKDAGKLLLYHAVGNTASVPESGKPEGTAGRVLIHDLSGDPIKSTTMSYGLRNPYRMSIDRVTGDLYMGEIDDPPGGAVYASPFASPVKDWGYRGGSIKAGLTGKEGGRALIGGIVYRGTKIPGICGRYFYAGWNGGGVKSIVAKDGKLVGTAASHAGASAGGIASFGEDGDGEMYIATQGGEVFKIEAM